MRRAAFVIIIFFASAFALFLLTGKKKADVKNLQLNPDQISDARVENIQIEGHEYSFNQGKITKKDTGPVTDSEKQKVSQMVFFYLTAKENPLFTSPDFDTKAYSDSLDILEKKEKDFKSLMKKSDPLFPISFLKAIPEVSNQQQQFMQTKSLENAQKLLASYKKASDSYKSEIENYVNNLKSKETVKSAALVFINVFTNREVYFSDIEKVRQNSQALEKEIAQRKQCLETGVGCIRKTAAFTEPKLEIENKKEVKLLPLSSLYRGDSSADLNFKPQPYEVASPCWGWGDNFSEPSQVFYLLPVLVDKTQSPSSPYNLRMKLATNNFYRKIMSSPTDQDLKKLGLEWTPQMETNSYLCTNLEYQPKLATLSYFFDKYKDKPLFETNESQIPQKYMGFWQKAANYEKDFLNSAVPSYNQLTVLANAYAYGFKILGESQVEDETRDEFLKRYLITNRNLGNFSTVLGTNIRSFEKIMLEEQNSPGSISRDESYYTLIYPFRSLWNILYFPYSPSFWVIGEKPQYLEKRLLSQDSGRLYIPYNELVEKYGEEKINSWHKIANDYGRKKNNWQ